MSYSSVRPVGSFFFALLLVFSLPIIYLISVLSGSLPPLRPLFYYLSLVMLYGYCDAVAVRDTIPRYWTTKSAGGTVCYIVAA